MIPVPRRRLRAAQCAELQVVPKTRKGPIVKAPDKPGNGIAGHLAALLDLTLRQIPGLMGVQQQVIRNDALLCG